MVTNNLPAPLPPSVEQAYRTKCVELRRRMLEVEESNDTYRTRKVRLLRSIRKMRLERAYLLETLGKRMKKNGHAPDGTGYVDEDSEGSSDGPPTPREKPLRTKRGHRRHPASPSVHNEANTINSSFMNENTRFQAYQPSSTAKGAQYSTQSPGSPRNGQHDGADPISFVTASSPTHSTSHDPTSSTNHPLVPAIPPSEAFAMYLESRFLSQRHKYPEGTTEAELVQLAQDSWENEDERTKQLYLLQENKQREAYQNHKQNWADYESDHRYRDRDHSQQEHRGSARRAPRERGERSRRTTDGGTAEKNGISDGAAVDRDVEMSDEKADGGAGGGFTAVNSHAG